MSKNISDKPPSKFKKYEKITNYFNTVKSFVDVDIISCRKGHVRLQRHILSSRISYEEWLPNTVASAAIKGPNIIIITNLIICTLRCLGTPLTHLPQ